ncbi:mCG145912, partial [Mus musculus]
DSSCPERTLHKAFDGRWAPPDKASALPQKHGARIQQETASTKHQALWKQMKKVSALQGTIQLQTQKQCSEGWFFTHRYKCHKRHRRAAAAR